MLDTMKYFGLTFLKSLMILAFGCWWMILALFAP